MVAVMAEVPKKPVGGAFGIYFNENRVEMTEEAIGLGYRFRGALAKVAISWWKAMSEAEKQPYEDKYLAKQEEYKNAMASYGAKKGAKARKAKAEASPAKAKASVEPKAAFAKKRNAASQELSMPAPKKGNVMEGVTCSRRERRAYLTKAMIVKHGQTKGCRRCFESGIHHSESCRVRFEKILDEESQDAALGLEATAVGGATTKAAENQQASAAASSGAGTTAASAAVAAAAQATLVSLSTMDMERVKIEKDNPLPGSVKEWADFCEKLGAARQMQTLAEIGGFFRSPKMAAEIRIELHSRQKRQKCKLSQQRYRTTMKGKEARRRYKTKSKMKKLGSILRMAVNHPHVIADAEVDAAMSSASVGGGASNSAGPVEKPNRSINNATCADMFADVSLPVMADGAAAAAASGDDDNDVERLEMASGMKFFVV